MRNAFSPVHRTRRLGITLIEVIGTLSILLMISLAAASMLGTITSVGIKGTRNRQARADVARFSQQFRHDIRSSHDIDSDESAKSVDLQMDGFTIRYQIRGDANYLTRERVGSSDTREFERYELTENCEPEFLLDADYVTARLTPSDAEVPWKVEVLRP